MAENRDLGRGPPNITSFGSLEIVGLSTLIYERPQLTLVFTHGQLGPLPIGGGGNRKKNQSSHNSAW